MSTMHKTILEYQILYFENEHKKKQEKQARNTTFTKVTIKLLYSKVKHVPNKH